MCTCRGDFGGTHHKCQGKKATKGTIVLTQEEKNFLVVSLCTFDRHEEEDPLLISILDKINIAFPITEE